MKRLPFLRKSKLIFLFSILTSGIYAQSNNIGFESGTTTGWTCGSGTYGKTKVQDCKYNYPLIINYDGNCLNQGGIDGKLEPINKRENRHTLVTASSGKDTNSLGNISCVAPAYLFPGGVNTYSFRLGNAVAIGTAGNPIPKDDSLALAEGIKFKLTVDSSNTGLTYLYSLFIKEGEPIGPGHAINQGPRFIVKISDAQDSVIDCMYKKIVYAPGSSSFKNGLTSTLVQWKYTDWTEVKLDLRSYIGQSITVEFNTADCFFPVSTGITSTNGKIDTICYMPQPGSHSAYAYVDLYCTPYANTAIPTVCANQNQVQICAPEGYAGYNWPSNQPGIQPPFNTQCVTILNPKEGDEYTVNLKSYTGTCSIPYKVKLKVNDFTLNDVVVCQGDSIQLHAIPVGSGNYDFNWQPNLYLNRYDVADPVYTSGETTTYTVTMKDKNQVSCDRIKMVKVSTRLYTTVNAGMDVTIRPSDTVKLNGAIGNGANKATWLGGAGTFIPNRFALNAQYVLSISEQTEDTIQLTLESIDTLSPCSASLSSMNIIISPITGIITNTYKLSVEMYPNPMNTELTILISGLESNTQAELKLYDYLGKEVRSQKLKNGTQKLYRENLSNGIYFVEIIDGKTVIQKKKIVINN